MEVVRNYLRQFHGASSHAILADEFRNIALEYARVNLEIARIRTCLVNDEAPEHIHLLKIMAEAIERMEHETENVG